jgi:hypothetical protein
MRERRREGDKTNTHTHTQKERQSRTDVLGLLHNELGRVHVVVGLAQEFDRRPGASFLQQVAAVLRQQPYTV